jgi:branched-subunit amino acid transport protein AzlD
MPGSLSDRVVVALIFGMLVTGVFSGSLQVLVEPHTTPKILAAVVLSLLLGWIAGTLLLMLLWDTRDGR